MSNPNIAAQMAQVGSSRLETPIVGGRGGGGAEAGRAQPPREAAPASGLRARPTWYAAALVQGTAWGCTLLGHEAPYKEWPERSSCDLSQVR